MSAANVVQAQCPQCKNSLRIPSNWIHEPMKCKHCGLVFQAKPPKEKKGNILGRAIKAATTLHKRRRRKKKKDQDTAPVAAPVAAPFQAPMPGMPMNVPTAKPLAGAFAAAPVATAVPAGGVMAGTAPVAAPAPFGGIAAGQNPVKRRRSRGSWQKIAFILIFFLGLGSLGAIIYQTNPELFNSEEQQASSGNTEPKATEPETKAKTETTKAATKPTTSKFVTKSTKPKTSLFIPKVTTKRIVRDTRPIAPVDTRRRDTRIVRPTDPNRDPVMVRNPDDMPSYTSKPNDTPYRTWPRRMLAVSINNYLYQNPVSYGKEKPFDKAVYSLSQALKVPNDQITMVSDRTAIPPTKAILEDAITRFTAGCRSVDHAVIVFTGHGIDVEGVPYLVPLMGDASDVKSLIPLDWIYGRLASCPAQQKLLILDVARFDPKRGEEFGKTERLGAQFAALMQKPPKGVQVLSACTAGQYSYEIQSDLLKVHGGVFQDAVSELNGVLRGVDQKIDGPIPVEDLKDALARRTSPKVLAYFNVKKIGKKADEKEEPAAKIEQTPELYGTPMAKAVAFDPKTDPAKKLVVKADADPLFKGGTATRGEIASILVKQREVPPLKQGDSNDFYLGLPFAKSALKAYTAKDDKDSDLRDFVNKAIKVLKDTNQAFADTMGPLPENQQQKNQVINGIANRQQNLAEVYAQLDASYEELKSVEKLREKETPLWKANYDYVTARLLFRMVHFYEYQVALGKIRKDDLPAFDKNVHRGYKLSPKAALSDRGDEVTLANSAKKVLKRLADESKGTPWEVIAKREMNTSLGLEWVAY